jgi:hypothetical protein
LSSLTPYNSLQLAVRSAGERRDSADRNTCKLKREESHLSITIIDSIENIWSNSGKGENDYSCIEILVGKYGVYVFRDKENGNILYVGEAREQDLKTRVKQNFTEHDTGGTFRKNYMEKEDVNFDNFKSFMRNTHIICFNLEKNMLVRTLESILIFTLNPKYNKDK